MARGRNGRFGFVGSGKSVLMQSIVLGIACTNTPVHAKIVLIDPTLGVDYFAFGKGHIAAKLEGEPQMIFGQVPFVKDSFVSSVVSALVITT